MSSLDFETEKQNFREYFNDNIELLHNSESSFSTLIKSLLVNSEELSASIVTSRVKDREECIKKFSRKYQSKLEEEETEYKIKDYITDLIGLRIVCLYEKNIKEVGDLLKEHFHLIDITDKCKLVEETENTFGYKGLHLDLKLSKPRNEMPEYCMYKDICFEVQVRTIIQDAWSVLDHKIKYKKSIPHKLKRRINSLAALFETADREFFSIREETEKLEKETKEKLQKDKTADEVLDVFIFSKIADKYFPDYKFYPHKVDGFVEEIIIHKEITESAFEKILTENFDTVIKYKDFIEGQHALNPYTIIRHTLYLSDKETFSRILYDYQRKTFDEWFDDTENE